MGPVVDGTTLRWNGRAVDVGAVQGFRERHGVFSGRSWLEVRGPGWRVPFGTDYGAVRASLRQALPELPFQADWGDGQFPRAPLGLPEGLALLAGLGVAAVAAGAAGWVAGPWAALAVAFAACWPLLRLRDGLVVHRAGMRAGPPWASRVPWHEVEEVRVEVGARRARVRVRTARGAGYATLPAALVPALRARVWRLGGLHLVEGRADLDYRYERWRAPAAGIPWGVLAGTAVAAAIAAEPWTVLTAGLLAMAGTALLGAAVEARATGWGSGGVLWGTLAYAVVLAAIALGTGGWL